MLRSWCDRVGNELGLKVRARVPVVRGEMLQVVYASAALAPLSELELTQLLMRARANNTRRGVTGLLLYIDGSFLQVLEGEDHVVEALLARIARDPRHDRVSILLRRPIEQRQYSEWAMGFVSPKHLTASLPGYSDYLSTRSGVDSGASAAEQLLASFREGRLRSYIGT
jgi:Sensors of blue-light using FAD